MKITKTQLRQLINEVAMGSLGPGFVGFRPGTRNRPVITEEEHGSGLYHVYQRDPSGSGKPRAAWEEHHEDIVFEIANLMALYPDMVDHGGETEMREYWEAAVREALRR